MTITKVGTRGVLKRTQSTAKAPVSSSGAPSDPTLRDIVPIEEVSVGCWTEIFERIGLPDGVTASTISHEAVIGAIERGDLSDEFTELLQVLHELGRGEGVDLLYQQAADAGIDTDSWRGPGARELIARVWLSARDDQRLAHAIQLARFALFERAVPNVLREFVGKRHRPCSTSRETMERLHALLLPTFERLGFGSELTVSPREDDGVVTFRVLRGGRVKAPLVIEGQVRRTLPFRPVQCDVIRYEASTGRLGLAPRAVLQVPNYPEAFGAALFDDRNHFSKVETCTLRPLQERGEVALHAERYEGIIERVSLVEFLWRRPDGSKVRLSGSNCFEQIDELGLPIKQGHLLEAKLLMQLLGPKSARTIIDVRAPMGAHSRNPKLRGIVDEYLEAIGVRLPRPDDGAVGGWSFMDTPRDESWWKQLVGDALPLLRSRRLLVPTRLRTLTHPDHPEAPDALEVRMEVLDDAPHRIGLSRDPLIASRLVGRDDVVGLAIDREAVARAIGADLSLAGSPMETAMPGCWDLGVLTLGNIPVRVFLLLAPPTWAPEKVDWLLDQATAPGERRVVLLPRGGAMEAQQPVVPVSLLRPPYDDLTPEIVDALRLGTSVPAILRASRRHVLVVDLVQRKVWVHRIQVPLTDQGLRFVEHVVRARLSHQELSTKELVKLIMPRGAVGDDSSARQAKAAVKRAIDGAVGSIVKQDLFPSLGPGRGYDVSVPCFMPEPPRSPVKKA